MKKLMKKKVSMFGKEFSVFAIVMVAMIGLASAALLPYFGIITGNAVVSQSVTINDVSYSEAGIEGKWNSNFVAGDSVVDCDGEDKGYNLKNNANVEATIQLETTCANTTEQDNGEQTITSINWAEECEGIDTEIYGTLVLTSKNTATWDPTTDKRITVEYTIVGDDFEYNITNEEGTAFSLDNYVLVYYKDIEEDQCTDENTPSKNRATGVITLADNIDSNLPFVDDFNNKETANYCGNCYGDEYTHCRGAKLWYIPKENADGSVAFWTNWEKFLYETDLIVYSDSTDNKITLPAGGGFNFCVENDFALNLVPDTYTIETQILPVVADN
ncbi:MAG: hypothetical protein ABIF18_01870 [archaeon]